MATHLANNLPTTNGNVPTFSLHVSNIPVDLEKDGIKSIFLDYGQVTGCVLIKSRGDTNQAYISYAKYNEAERAIYELDNKPPLMLRLQFQDKNLKPLHKSPIIDLSGPITDHRYRMNHLDTLKDAVKAIDQGRINCTEVLKPDSYTSDDDLLYPYPTDPTVFNPYDGPGPFYDTNLMYTRGITHLSRDGHRRVCYGRGYTHYNLPEPHYNIASYLQRVCEKREKGSYEYAPEDLQDDSGNCKICSSPTAFRCQKCGITFYCGRTCQVKDWPNHKNECQPLPPLVKKLSLQASRENGELLQQKNPQAEYSHAIKEKSPVPVCIHHGDKS